MKKSFNKMLSCTLLAGAMLVPTAALATDSSLGIDFSDTTGFGVDTTHIQVDNIRVDFVFTNPFDPTHPTIQSTYFNIPFRFDMTSLHLIPDLGTSVVDDPTTACSVVSVIVSDSYTGTPLTNAAVTIGGETEYTSSTGIASFSYVTAGTASISASASGYQTSSRTASVDCQTPTSVGLALDPTSGSGAVAANEVRIKLTWGENPSDLDSHLTGPTALSDGSTTDETNRFHVYYGNRNADEVASLDVDDVTSYGPETITIIPPSGASHLRAGLYRYSVFHYSGSSNIPNSGADVTLNLGGTSSRDFLPPADTSGVLAGGYGDLWTVFELMVDSAGSITVLPVNTYSTGNSSGSVRTTTTGWGSVEKGVDFGRLPRK